MVERVTHMSLEEYMARNIWNPLDMSTATFRIDQHLDLKDRLPEMTIRQGLNHPIYGTTLNRNGRLVPPMEDEPERITAVEEPSSPSTRLNDDFGGGGAYSSAPDFATLLASLCSNDGRVLSPSSVDEMFTPQLTAAAQSCLQTLFAVKEINDIFSGGLPQTSPPLALSWGLGGMLVLDDVPPTPEPLYPEFLPPPFLDFDPTSPASWLAVSQSMAAKSSGAGHAAGAGTGTLAFAAREEEEERRSRRRRRRRRGKGTMFWAGLPNLYWWMDREAGVSGIYASQLLPQGDPRSLEAMGRFEEFCYETLLPVRS